MGSNIMSCLRHWREEKINHWGTGETVRKPCMRRHGAVWQTYFLLLIDHSSSHASVMPTHFRWYLVTTPIFDTAQHTMQPLRLV